MAKAITIVPREYPSRTLTYTAADGTVDTAWTTLQDNHKITIDGVVYTYPIFGEKWTSALFYDGGDLKYGVSAGTYNKGGFRDQETQTICDFLGNPAAPSNTAVHAAVTLTAAAQTVTTGITNPDFARSLIIKGNAAGIAGDVTITGKRNGVVISETIALDEANAVEGDYAFDEVTSILLPAKTNASGDTVSVGYGSKLGLSRVLRDATIIATHFNGTVEGTPATLAKGGELHSTTIDLNSALNGSAVRCDYYVVGVKQLERVPS